MMQLVNDIDLSVSSGDQELLPWVLSPSNPLNLASRGVDSRNNVEQVTIDSPTGAELVRLAGTDVPQGPQDVVLHWTAVPCALEAADTGQGDGAGGGGGGCTCTAQHRARGSLLYLLLGLALGRRRASRRLDRER